MTQTTENLTQEISVSFRMKGEDAARFLRFKRDQNLQLVSEAARKLVLDRLAEIEKNGKKVK